MTDATSGGSLHEWDAAYVLGALSSDDRRRFEEHLEECAECRASVADLAVMPSLLGKVKLVEESAPAPSLVDSAKPNGDPSEHRTLATLAHRVRRRRLARRWSLAAASVLAAAAIAAAVVLPTALATPPAEGTRIALEQTTPGPLSATVSLTSKKWGTAVSMHCRYEGRNGPGSYTNSYALYVTDAAGDATRVASWSAWPGADIHAAGSVDLPTSQLRTVQVRDASTDAVLLSSPVK